MRKAQIVRWGKSLAVRIPKGVAERGVVGTDGTDPNFSAAKLGERPVWSPYFGPHISPVVLGRMLDESVPQLNAHNDRKYTSDFAPCHDIQKLSKLTNKMIALSKKALKGKVWETFRGKAFQGNVVLNFTRFPKGEFAAYGRSYHEAANRLVTSMESRHYRDPDACPIVFLYRHAVELYLKAIIHWGNMLLRINSRPIVAHKNIFQEHRLGVLLKSVKPILKLRKQLEGWGDPHFDCFRDVEKIIGELEQYDPRSSSFRYPVDTGGQKATLPHHLGFNVISFGEKFDHLLQVLDWIAEMVYLDFQSQAEALNELQNGVRNLERRGGLSSAALA